MTLVPNGMPTPRAFTRKMFSEMSDRTFARYWKCHERMGALEECGAIDRTVFLRAIKLATRPNGSLNVAELDRVTDGIASVCAVAAED